MSPPRHWLSPCYSVALVLLLGATPLHASTSRPQSTRPAATTMATDDCFSVGDTPEREACFARMTDAQVSVCERYRPLACMPHKDMFTATKTLDQLVSGMIEASKKKFSSYAGGDPTYPTNLAKGIRDADTAWQAYRDAHCRLEPMLEGMSQKASGDLIEKCRLDLTHQRIKQLREWIGRLQAKD